MGYKTHIQQLRICNSIFLGKELCLYVRVRCNFKIEISGKALREVGYYLIQCLDLILIQLFLVESMWMS